MHPASIVLPTRLMAAADDVHLQLVLSRIWNDTSLCIDKCTQGLGYVLILILTQ